MSANVFPGGASISGEDGFLSLTSRGIKTVGPSAVPSDGCIGHVYTEVIPNGVVAIADAATVSILKDLTVGPGIYLLILQGSVNFTAPYGNNLAVGVNATARCDLLTEINQTTYALNGGINALLTQSSHMLHVTDVDPQVTFTFYYDSTNGSGGSIEAASAYTIIKIA